jgi:acetoin utilization deacetylase AcuC-like enzyme
VGISLLNFIIQSALIGQNQNAFCVVRPPGQNARIQGLLAGGESCGFCIFNNVAAGALHAISEQQNLCKCCPIVDIDMHHENGTEEIARKCHDLARLLFFSIHLFDHNKKRNRGSPAYGYKFYPGTGEEDDLPLNIINVPIAPLWKEQNNAGSKDATAAPKSTHNTRQKVKEKNLLATSSPREWGTGNDGSATEITKASDTESETESKVSKKSANLASSPQYATMGHHAYQRAVQDQLLPALRAFNPHLILISAGFDAAKGDVGNVRHFVGGDQHMGLDLEPEDYTWTTQKVYGSQLIAHHALFMFLIPLCP